MSYVTAGRKWKRKDGLRIVGKTETGNIVLSGSDLFNLTTSNGIPLDICLTYFKKLNIIIDWIGFVDEALDAYWNYQTIIKKIEYSLIDVYDKQYSDNVILRIKYYLINKIPL